MRNQIPAILCITIILLLGSLSLADDELAEKLPSLPSLTPAEAMQSFSVLPGFRLEQVATEPMVHSPVAMAFDERGRLFVVEMTDYSEQEHERLGTVHMLEDVDGDGVFDKSTLFANDLSWPTAITCFDGGVFVGAAPDIIYCKDTDGDGQADLRQIAFTGFNRTNVQGLLNSLQWGYDCRIYGSASSCGGIVSSPQHPQRQPVDCRRRDFSFDPKTLDFRTETGGAQHGMSFDDWGRRFVCSNSNHLQMIMYDERYAARNRFYAMPAGRMSIAADGPQAEVFRISPVEPWRILRTEWRKSGKAKGAIEGNGRASGYFTGATGTTIYRGDALPEELRGQAFVADVGSNLVHRKALQPDGIPLVGKRIDPSREIIASSDTWFRPVQFGNAPDGALYILDMYRQVIEHPKSIPPEIKAHLDLTKGCDQGRIYRLVPDNFQQRAKQQLDQLSTAELVHTLEHRNGWHRDTAARLLYERADPEALPQLELLVSKSQMPEARLQAMYLLQAAGKLSANVLNDALGDSHPRVREHAVRLAEQFLAIENASGKQRVQDKLCSMHADPDIRVRYQLAFAAAEFPREEKIPLLGKVLRQNIDDPWITAAVFSSLADGAGDLLTLLIDSPPVSSATVRNDLLKRLAKQIAARGDAAELQQAERCLTAAEEHNPVSASAIVRGLATGVVDRQRTGHADAKLPPSIVATLQRIVDTARVTAVDDSRDLQDRVDAIRTLSLGPLTESSELLAAQLDARVPQPLQLATLATLVEYHEDEVAAILLAAWRNMTPRVRAVATEVLFSRPGWIERLFAAIDEGTVSLAEIDTLKLQLLDNHPNKKLRRESQRLLQSMRLGERSSVVQEYQQAVNRLEGNTTRGRQVFQKNCTACHRLEKVGSEIGPNLTNFRNRGAEAIVLNVLDPNREVNPQYVTYVMQDSDGRPHIGMIVDENDNSISLLRGESAKETLLRSEIDGPIVNTGRSLMPEGLERVIDHQSMTDLIAYILSLK